MLQPRQLKIGREIRQREIPQLPLQPQMMIQHMRLQRVQRTWQFHDEIPTLHQMRRVGRPIPREIHLRPRH